jgi:hypothetical protein
LEIGVQTPSEGKQLFPWARNLAINTITKWNAMEVGTNPIRGQVFISLGKKLDTNCLVLVGSRNGK